MKILFVIDSLSEGGSEKSLAEMLPYLVRAGIKIVIVLFYQSSIGVEKIVRSDGHDVRMIKSRRLVTRVMELRRIIKNEKPDIVHTTLFQSHVAGCLASAGLDVIVMTSLVNSNYEKFRLTDPHIKWLGLKRVQFIDSFVSRFFTDHFHAVTNYVRDAAVRDLGLNPARISVVERGRNPGWLGEPGPERKKDARMRLGLGESDEVLLNVGRQEHQKGQKFLISAAKILYKNHPKLAILIAGNPGNFSGELAKLSEELSTVGYVKFLGHRDDVPLLLSAADMFVFPSLFEGAAGALIEAMALGLPVIASDIPSIREVIEPGKNGILVEPGSAEKLAAAIDILLKDREKLNTFGRRSREIFLERYTVDKNMARMVELYNEVLKKYKK